MTQENNFPKTFMWGVGHAAFQVEGHTEPSDWKRWTHTDGKIADASNADQATDFWNRYKEDFALAKELGANTFRMSIAWERVEVQAGVWNVEALEHYKKMILSCIDHGLEPVVTLHHFVLPEWIADKGGICSDEFEVEFADYAEKVVSFMSQEGPLVKWWMTFNEPQVLTNFGYITGGWPPGEKDLSRFMLANRNLVRAHVSAVKRIRTLNLKDLKISIAQHWRDFQPKSRLNPTHKAAALLLHQVFNRNFVIACQTGINTWWMPGSKFYAEKLDVDGGTLDYLGINYYGRLMVKTMMKDPFVEIEEGIGEKTDLGWEICPASLTNVLRQAWSFRLPILVSENGLADRSDSKRAKFIEDHVAALGQALVQGVNVLGYLHWSLTDNFEWAEGLEPRFGLVEMDYEKLIRTPRPSFYAYQALIQKLQNS
ncbi:family 1 glycosylhydrolase [bacterium]|nr:family 1 glycosylhydrolase [bacterium]